jgi:hypothetical protein
MSEIKVDVLESSSSSSVPSGPLPSEMDLLRSMMSLLTQQGEESKKMREELTVLRREVDVTIRKVTRRRSMLLPVDGPTTPLPSPPKVSSMTHSAFKHLRTPASGPMSELQGDLNMSGNETHRMSGNAMDGFNESDRDDGAEDENQKDEAVTFNTSSEEEEEEEFKVPITKQRKARKVNEEKEAAKLAKVMSKRKPPSEFFGKEESEKEGVEQWVIDANDYLDSQFGQLAHQYPKERMKLIRGYIKGPAADWITAALQTDPTQTWETLQGPFIEFIRGGRESRSLWLEKMKNLVYGRGKCKDLLSLEQAFEQLRVKLYPTSSTDPAMNEVVGREYAEAIRRGDIGLYKEMLRILGGKERITLSEWKSAAVSAVKIVALTSNNNTRQSGSQGQFQKWGGNRYAPLAVQEMNTEGSGHEDRTDKGEGQAGGRAEGQPEGSAEVQQMQGRKASSQAGGFRQGPFKPRHGGPYIPPEEWKIVVDKNLCWQCYLPGHHIGDSACKDKGKPRRRPTQAELNA